MKTENHENAKIMEVFPKQYDVLCKILFNVATDEQLIYILQVIDQYEEEVLGNAKVKQSVLNVNEEGFRKRMKEFVGLGK